MPIHDVSNDAVSKVNTQRRMTAWLMNGSTSGLVFAWSDLEKPWKPQSWHPISGPSNEPATSQTQTSSTSRRRRSVWSMPNGEKRTCELRVLRYASLAFTTFFAHMEVQPVECSATCHFGIETARCGSSLTYLTRQHFVQLFQIAMSQ